MSRARFLVRLLLGSIFLLFSVDYFFPFLPEMPVSKAGESFLNALSATGYMFPLIKTIEIVSAILLLTGYAVPLALVLLAPIITNIALYHAFLDPNGRAIAATLLACEFFLLWAYRESWRSLVSLGPRQSQRSASIAVADAPLEARSLRGRDSLA